MEQQVQETVFSYEEGELRVDLVRESNTWRAELWASAEGVWRQMNSVADAGIPENVGQNILSLASQRALRTVAAGLDCGKYNTGETFSQCFPPNIKDRRAKW